MTPPLARLAGYARALQIRHAIGLGEPTVATIQVAIMDANARAADGPAIVSVSVSDRELIERWRAAHLSPAKLRITIEEDPLEPLEAEVRRLRGELERLENELIRARGR